MINSKTSLKDLSFSGNDAQGNIMHLIDRCQTFIGRAVLEAQLRQSPKDFSALQAQQEVVRFWADHPQFWPDQITNGTIVMLEKFYESADTFSGSPAAAGFLNGKLFQKLFRRNEYHFIHFSITHLADFMRGCFAFVSLLHQPGLKLPSLLQEHLEAMALQLEHKLCEELCLVTKDSGYKTVAELSFHARRAIKVNVQQLSNLYARLDAWHAMAVAGTEHRWVFPELLEQGHSCFQAKGLFHPLLDRAVCYDLDFDAQHNFMILTGANMSGKTTMMRAMGVAAILAHLGMAVPAKSMTISFMDGVLTNMHVEDNLLRGDSFFMAEVKSIKQTIEAIVQGGPQLVLMDELFKGTNVHDACECTKAIVEGLLHYPKHIMVLSTHLHEVAHYFEHQPGLSFCCFGTSVSYDGVFVFDYQLKPGISDERIGFKILRQQGIVDLLQNGAGQD